MTGQPKGNPGASPTFVGKNRAIYWPVLFHNGFRLQVRIVKAIELRRWLYELSNVFPLTTFHVIGNQGSNGRSSNWPPLRRIAFQASPPDFHGYGSLVLFLAGSRERPSLWLEPYEGKRSFTVLRGEGGRETPALPGREIGSGLNPGPAAGMPDHLCSDITALQACDSRLCK